MSEQGFLTVRGENGEYITRIAVGSRAVLHKDQTLTVGRSVPIRYQDRRGEWCTERVLFSQYMRGLGISGRDMAEIRKHKVITIRDEYSY